jgi:hypothetical protein
MRISEPFGQIDLRPSLVAALADDGADSQPRLVPDPDKVVFQYLGNINRPGQIAFASGAGRFIYDFRDRRVIETRPDAPPDVSASLTGDRFLRLVHLWERIVLARRGVEAAPLVSGTSSR